MFKRTGIINNKAVFEKLLYLVVNHNCLNNIYLGILILVITYIPTLFLFGAISGRGVRQYGDSGCKSRNEKSIKIICIVSQLII